MAVFSILLVIIATSAIVTEQQVSQLNAQEEMANSIERGTNDLNVVSNDYFLKQESQQLTRWQSEFSALSNNLSNLKLNSPQQEALINNINDDMQRLNSVFSEVVIFLKNAPRNVSVRIDPAFQNQWSIMAAQNQALAFDASLLSQALDSQASQAMKTNIFLIMALLGTFAAFFATIYVMVFRRTLKSVTDLQEGINTIGSGDLNYIIETKRQDEISELSYAFNQMAANLKTVTASKTELEREIEGRKLAETALRASEQRWATTLASIGDAVIATDVSGRVTFMNNVAEELTGWTMIEASQKPVKQVFNIINEQTRQEVNNPVTRVLEEGLIIGLANHTLLLRKDGKEVPIDDSGAPIIDNYGKTLGVVLVFRDITEHKQMQSKLEEYSRHLENLVAERTKQLKDAERLAAIGATAGMVGHDIRNPLQTVTGELYLAKSELKNLPDGDAKASLKESLDMIGEQTVYVNKIVSDLQDYARPLTPCIEESDLKKIVQSVLATIDIPENVKVNQSIEKNFQKIKIDQSYVQRIITNLTNNAVQAMPNGGKLTIKVTRKNGKALISVEDTGEGIPKEVESKLFTPLFTTKSKGQGFGLAVVKRLTEALNGTVAFESEAGKGTIFTIELPL